MYFLLLLQCASAAETLKISLNVELLKKYNVLYCIYQLFCISFKCVSLNHAHEGFPEWQFHQFQTLCCHSETFCMSFDILLEEDTNIQTNFLRTYREKMSTPGQASSALNPHRSQVENRMHGMASAVLTEMRVKRELCDLEIRVGKVKIDAHKVILCSCSSYFRWVLHLRRAKAVKSYTLSKSVKR